MTVETVGVQVDRGAGIGRDAGQDCLEQPAHAGRQGSGGDRRGTQTVLTRRPGRGGQGYVSTRCPKGGARTVMPRRTQRGEGSAMTRRPRHGTQTVLTRRPRRTGEGYVSTRCPCGGTQTAMPRRTLGGEGSLMTWCPRLGGYATAVGRHAGAGASLPGGARCSRKFLHLPIPVRRAYRRGVGERQRPGGRVGRASPPGPLSTMWRGGVCRRGKRYTWTTVRAPTYGKTRSASAR